MTTVIYLGMVQPINKHIKSMLGGGADTNHENYLNGDTETRQKNTLCTLAKRLKIMDHSLIFLQQTLRKIVFVI